MKVKNERASKMIATLRPFSQGKPRDLFLQYKIKVEKERASKRIATNNVGSNPISTNSGSTTIGRPLLVIPIGPIVGKSP